jgi:hypothetical protein
VHNGLDYTHQAGTKFFHETDWRKAEEVTEDE